MLAIASNAQAALSLAEIVESMEEGEWRELPDTSVESVMPNRNEHPHWGRQGPRAVTRSWSGAAFDTKRNQLIMKGGGHGAYGGNEVYVFDLEDMTWERATDPSPHEPDPEFSDRRSPEQYYRTTDDTPVSRHTYDGLLYLPNIDKTLLWGGSLYSVGNSYDAHAWMFDSETREWSRGGEANRTRIQVATGYDPETGHALVEYGYGAYLYDPEADEWSVLSSGNNLMHGHVGAVDPENRLFIQVFIPNSDVAQFAYYDLEHPRAGRQHPDATGDLDFSDDPLPGITYHPGTGLMVLWRGWKETWVLDPKTWEVRRLDNAPGPAPDHYGTDSYPVRGKYKTWGIFGRWAYVPDHDVFIGYGHVEDNVWLYKLPEDPFNWTPPEDESAQACPVDLCVGPDYPLKKPSQAAQQAEEGAEIAIQGGEYKDCARWRKGVTIRGVDGRPRIGGEICDRKAIWVVQGDETVIENVELYGGSDDGRNGDGIRHEGRRLVVRDSDIHSSRMGILTNHGEDVELELFNNHFHGMRNRSGLAHQVYAARIGSLIAEANLFEKGGAGHHLKSVAARNAVRYNHFVNRDDTRASLLDVWGCSTTDIIGNTFSYGGDSGALQAISVTTRRESGGEIECERDVAVNILFNTAVFEQSNPRWSSFVRNQFGAELELANNLVMNTRDVVFTGGDSKTGLGRERGNLHLEGLQLSLFASPDDHDYRLVKPLEEAADVGLYPGRQYRHPRALDDRDGPYHPGAHGSKPE